MAKRGRPRVIPYQEPDRTKTNWRYMWCAYDAISEAASKEDEKY